MAAEAPPGGHAVLPVSKTDPDQNVDPDPERSADREAVALAMVTDLTKATGILPYQQAEIPEPVEMRVGQRKKQRKRPREDEKICIVCGDKALAHNFDAITCESCKAFFRRNALRAEPMVCQFKGECRVSVQTRRFCPACRLKKCFTMGMKADLILDETEKKARMNKVSENRARRMAKDASDYGDSQVGSSSGQVLTVMNFADHMPSNNSTTPAPSAIQPMLGCKEDGDNAHQQPSSRQQQQQQQQQKTSESTRTSMTTLHAVLTAAPAFSVSGVTPTLSFPTTGYQQKVGAWPSQFSSPSHQPAPTPSPQPPPTGSPSNNNAASMDLQTFTSDFQHVPRDLLPSDPHMYWRLSEEEKTLLTQLSSAYQDTIMILPQRVPCEDGGFLQENPSGVRSVESIFETSEKNTRQLINFVQRLGDFQMLREDDKIALLQASGMRSVIMRWTGLFVVERSTWLTQFGEVGVATTSAIFGHVDIIEELASFCHCMKTIMKNDVTLFVLTHCLIVFDPREHNLVDRQLISTFRDKYMVLLKHYLDSEYSFLYSERYLQAVLDKIIEIRSVAKKCLEVMKEFRDYVPPLVKQLLNLHENC